MKKNQRRRNHCRIILFFALLYFIVNLASIDTAFAQATRAVMGEMATCKLTVNTNLVNSGVDKFTKANSANNSFQKASRIPNKIYQLKPNQLGLFDQVSNIQPLQIVPVEVSYPQGKTGEKVILAAEDGGRFDNGKMFSILQLDAQRKVSFNFQVSDQSGIFHVSLRKGNDIKVIQLWVGHDPFSVKN